MAKNRSQYSLEILLGAKKASSFQSGINGAKNELEGMSSTAKKVAGLIATAFGAIKIKDFVKESVDTFLIMNSHLPILQLLQMPHRLSRSSLTKRREKQEKLRQKLQKKVQMHLDIWHSQDGM